MHTSTINILETVIDRITLNYFHQIASHIRTDFRLAYVHLSLINFKDQDHEYILAIADRVKITITIK